MKKILTIATAALALILFNLPSTPPETLTQTSNDLYIIHSKPLTSNTLLAPYTNFDTFNSEEIKSPFEFTSVGLSWEQITPENSRIESYIRFQQNNKWTEWLDLEEEQDLLNPDKHYAIASSEPSQSFQYRFDLYTPTKDSPLVRKVEWTFINSAEITAEPTPKAKIAASLPDIQSQVITRAAWGANETLRLLTPGAEQILIERDPVFYEKYKSELQYSRVVNQDENGNLYVWPLQYPESVKKIVIHHTATTKDLDNPAQAIRDIYTYHTVTRGWGDIGYNYIVDQQGKIYEGRFGGEGVIGAHSGPGNHGSIGIAMLGNYQDNPVPETVLTSLSQFIYQKSKIYGIAPDETSTFRGKEMPNVFGHRDIMATTCPGQYLYDKIPFIRTLSATAFVQKEKFLIDYDFQDHSELYYADILPNESQNFTIKLENIGNKEWDSNTVLKLKSDPQFANTLYFPTAQNLILAKINESQVAPGEFGTFNFTLSGGSIGKTVYLQLTPSINGTIDTPDHLSIAVSVQQPTYSYDILEATYPPEQMKSGETFNGKITVKNTGNVTWEKLTFSGQPGNYTVNPDETVNFNYTYTAPKTSGEFNEKLTLNLPNIKFSSSPEIAFQTLVYRGEYDSILYTKTPANTLQKGENYTLAVTLKNTGLQTWSEKDLKANFLKDSSLKIVDLHMSPKAAAIGETTKISFTVEVAPTAPTNGLLLANFRIKENKISRPIVFNYQTATATTTEITNKIRIKLSSLNVEPTITADGSFGVYSGDKFLANLAADDELKISLQAGKFAITAANSPFFEIGPIRIIPKNQTILQIKNFEHRPAWDKNLNDNQYRGILEIREENGNLIVINELDLESYLKGLGEVSNSELPEKIKAIITAARSYAKFYTTQAEKFPGKPYNLDDDPAVSQKYLGYGLEKRSPNVAAGVDATTGQVIAYNNQIVKAPYFNQSNGIATKSAQEVWGWTDTPYLISVPDTFCDSPQQTFLGHGVGLSGCGAKTLAEQGKTYQEILKYYYTGIEILDLY